MRTPLKKVEINGYKLPHNTRPDWNGNTRGHRSDQGGPKTFDRSKRRRYMSQPEGSNDIPWCLLTARLPGPTHHYKATRVPTPTSQCNRAVGLTRARKIHAAARRPRPIPGLHPLTHSGSCQIWKEAHVRRQSVRSSGHTGSDRDMQLQIAVHFITAITIYIVKMCQDANAPHDRSCTACRRSSRSRRKSPLGNSKPRLCVFSDRTHP